MACLGSKSSIDLTELSVFVRSMGPTGASQLGDFLNVGDCSGRPARLGEEAKRLVFVVADRLKRLIQVSPRVRITFYRDFHQQEPCDRAREDCLLAQRLPDEARPERPGSPRGRPDPRSKGCRRRRRPPNRTPVAKIFTINDADCRRSPATSFKTWPRFRTSPVIARPQADSSGMKVIGDVFVGLLFAAVPTHWELRADGERGGSPHSRRREEPRDVTRQCRLAARSRC